MKHLELHIIQSVPVSCLNRDDLNSPKTAVFGGVQRARVSSQSWKRAIRELAKELDSNGIFRGDRSRRMVSELSKRLVASNIEKEAAVIIAEHVADIVETLDSKLDADGFKKIKTMMFFSPAEYDAIANAVTDEIKISAQQVNKLSKQSEDITNKIMQSKKDLDKLAKKNENTPTEDERKQLEKELENLNAGLEDLKKAKEKEVKALKNAFKNKVIKDAIKSVDLKDAADIALFGRMVANDHSLTVEAASMFSHALSVHKADNEIDFFAAVDDLQPKEESGAGMTGTLEFNSATYYRFAALNLDMLADEDHLNSMTKEERKSVVRTFIEATIRAVPVARKNTMNVNTIPVYVFGVVREKGHPIQLVNAFENPVRTSGGYVSKTIELLKAEYSKLKDTWGIEAVHEAAIPDATLNSFLDGMVKYVV